MRPLLIPILLCLFSPAQALAEEQLVGEMESVTPAGGSGPESGRFEIPPGCGECTQPFQAYEAAKANLQAMEAARDQAMTDLGNTPSKFGDKYEAARQRLAAAQDNVEAAQGTFTETKESLLTALGEHEQLVDEDHEFDVEAVNGRQEAYDTARREYEAAKTATEEASFISRPLREIEKLKKQRLMKEAEENLRQARLAERNSADRLKQAQTSLNTAASTSDMIEKGSDARLAEADGYLTKATTHGQGTEGMLRDVGVGYDRPGAGQAQGQGYPEDDTPIDPAKAARARNHLDGILEQDPANAQALAARAHLNYNVGDKAAACSDANAALASDPDNKRAFGITKLACQRDPLAGAYKFGTHDLRRKEGFGGGGPAGGGAAGAGALMNRVASSGKKTPGTISGARGTGAVPRLRPENYDKVYKSADVIAQARAQLKGGRYAIALDLARKALEFNPRNHEAYSAMASAYRGSGDFKKALAAAEEGLRLAPSDTSLLNTKAHAQLKTKDYKGALEAAQAVLDINPSNALAHALMAYALGKMGDRDGMIDALRRAAAIDPRFQSSLEQAAEASLDDDILFLLPGERAPRTRGKDTGGLPSWLRNKKTFIPIVLIAFGALAILWLLSQGMSSHPVPADGEDTEGQAEAVAQAQAAAAQAQAAAAQAQAAARAQAAPPAGAPSAAAGGPAAMPPIQGPPAGVSGPAAPGGPVSPGDGGERNGPAVLPPVGGTDDPQSAPAQKVGALLIGGKYHLRRKIGEGGMGVVYEGYDTKLDRKVALKQMRPELKADRGLWEMFMKEARTVSHLSHPYIVGIHDMVDQDTEAFLVFDFVDGKPLSEIIYERKRLPLAECAGLMRNVCEAIDFAHKSKVLHRDLKPANIMVDANGYAKVMDFGLAREAKDKLSRLTRQDSSGTPAYMAPEQHLGKAGRPSDIYSLGVCLYEMLTGRIPFPGPDFLAQKERRVYAPVSSLVPGLPGKIDMLLTAVFEPDPEKRVSDAPELLDTLKEVQ